MDPFEPTPARCAHGCDLPPAELFPGRCSVCDETVCPWCEEAGAEACTLLAPTPEAASG